VLDTVLPDGGGFVGRSHRRDDGGAQRFGPWVPGGSRRRRGCVNQNGFTLLDDMDLLEQGPGGEAFCEDRGRQLRRNIIGQLHQRIRFDQAYIGIRAERKPVGDPVTDL
jgi:hypothetical protein